ncbi:MAG: hypothetical protein GX776_03950 [Oxalobacter sp.]|nr:hypothetical protein [Oxalobacter sp.]
MTGKNIPLSESFGLGLQGADKPFYLVWKTEREVPGRKQTIRRWTFRKSVCRPHRDILLKKLIDPAFMNELTDDIRQQIRNGWRAGIEENGHIAVFEIVSRLGDQLKGDEKWTLYPHVDQKEDGPVTENPRRFFDLDIRQLVYCHSPSNGQQYMLASLIRRYE